MINSDFLFNRILQNVGLDTLHNSLIKDKTDFVILVKPAESNHTELYGFTNEENQLHEGLPTSLPDIQTREENITDIINELKALTGSLLESIETPFINSTENITSAGAVDVGTTVSPNVTTPYTTTSELITKESIYTTEDTTEQATQISSTDSTEDNFTIPPRNEANIATHEINSTAAMPTTSSSSLLENSTESSTTTKEIFETTFVPDYDVEGSVVVGEIIAENTDEISGDSSQFRDLDVDFLPRIDFQYMSF